MHNKTVAVAGHVCLDMIPKIFPTRKDEPFSIQPGTLINVGPALFATGGAVANTGLALHRLGVRTTLMGKIADDLFGKAILDIFNQYDPNLTTGMTVASNEQTSYSVVINPPGIDRTFLHCNGTNSTFTSDDLDVDALEHVSLLHFGYPPLMPAMYRNGGEQLAKLMAKVKQAGVTTSLDMSYVDPNSEAGQVHWRKVLEDTLPHVDLFLPSLDELLFMIDRSHFDAIMASGDAANMAQHIDENVLQQLGDQLIALGAAAVVIKLGEQGLYLRSTNQPDRLKAMNRCCPENINAWLDRELYTACYDANVIGTTGAGDCTIAGFLAAVTRSDTPEQCIQAAVAVGAASVESADATGGIKPWHQIEQRLQAGWTSHAPMRVFSHWKKHQETGVYCSPRDAASYQ